MAALVLMGTDVVLRPPRSSDVADVIANGRHAEIVRAYGGDPRDADTAVSQKHAEAWVAGQAASETAWVVEPEGRCIGGAGLHSHNEHDRRALYAVGLQVPELLGLGIGTEVTRLVLTHAFATLGLHRVGLRVLADNSRAIRCYEKCGFRREGIERESARVGDEWLDDWLMGVLATEFSA